MAKMSQTLTLPAADVRRGDIVDVKGHVFTISASSPAANGLHNVRIGEARTPLTLAADMPITVIREVKR